MRAIGGCFLSCNQFLRVIGSITVADRPDGFPPRRGLGVSIQPLQISRLGSKTQRSKSFARQCRYVLRCSRFECVTRRLHKEYIDMVKDERFYAFIIAHTSRSRSRIQRIRIERKTVTTALLIAALVTAGSLYGIYGLTQQAAHLKTAFENQR